MLPGVFGGLALAVVEIRRNGDDRLGDRLAQIGFGIGFEFRQHHRRNFLRAVFTPRHRDADAHIVCRSFHYLIRHHLPFGFGLLEAASDEALLIE